MELWIRSQDKDSLIKVEKIELIYDYLCNEDIKIVHIETDKGTIGSYATKERALEVLDEIQAILKPHLIIKNSGKIIGAFEDTIIREGATYETKELTTYVYEMPKE